jgi:tetratricopeptide (TPR) repeat protein
MNAEDIKEKTEEKKELAKALRDVSVELYNNEHMVSKALEAVGKACELDPDNSQYLFERDLLLEEAGSDPVVRLSLLEERKELLSERDDLALNYAHVLNLNGKIDEAADILLGRDFKLDREGQIKLAEEYRRTLLTMAVREVTEGNRDRGIVIGEMSLTYPKNLGIDPDADLPDNMGWYMLGEMHREGGNEEAAEIAYKKAAEGETTPRLLTSSADIPSDHIYWCALAKARLGQKKEALDLMRKLIDFGNESTEKLNEIQEDTKKADDTGSFKTDLKKKNENYLKRLISLGVRGLGEISG